MTSARSKKPVLRFRTVILSDVHLGIPDCKVTEVNHFLKNVTCDKLILNGDIIDGWALMRGGRWTRKHTRFIRLVLTKAEKHGTEVVYLRGNHDDILGRFLPLTLNNLQLVEEHIHETERGRYLCIHGDVFDVVTTQHKFLAVIGAIGYQGLLRLNRIYNRYRQWRGKEYLSVSATIKAKVKSAVSYIGRYEEQLPRFAAQRGCDGIICGHIHTPEDKMVGGVHYLNSGDWVESLTALVEHDDGRFEILGYDTFRERLEAVRTEAKAQRAQARALRTPQLSS